MLQQTSSQRWMSCFLPVKNKKKTKGSYRKLVNNSSHSVDAAVWSRLIGTGQHFLIKNRAKNDAKGFSRLQTDFRHGPVEHCSRSWPRHGADGCQASLHQPAGSLMLLPTGSTGRPKACAIISHFIILFLKRAFP